MSLPLLSPAPMCLLQTSLVPYRTAGLCSSVSPPLRPAPSTLQGLAKPSLDAVWAATDKPLNTPHLLHHKQRTVRQPQPPSLDESFKYEHEVVDITINLSQELQYFSSSQLRLDQSTWSRNFPLCFTFPSLNQKILTLHAVLQAVAIFPVTPNHRCNG